MKFWNDHKAAISLSVCAIAKELLDNYWIFSSMPMVDGGGTQIGLKGFFLISQLLVNAGLWGTVGYGIDCLRELNNARVSEKSSLVSV